MQRQLTFTVHGAPIAKGAPRARDAGAFIQIYADPKSRKYETGVRFAAQLAMAEAGLALFGEALAVAVGLYLPIPKSWSNKKRNAAAAGVLLPAKKPDFDNLTKAAVDACKGVVWKDDALITDCTIRKRYSHEPRLEMHVEPAPLGLEDAAQARAA